MRLFLKNSPSLLTLALCLAFRPCLAGETNPWNKVLSLLNSQVAGMESLIPPTRTLDEDLFSVNKEELDLISKKWKVIKTAGKNRDKSFLRAEENTFFYKEIEALNSHVYSLLEGTASTSPKAVDYRLAAKKALAKVINNPLTSPENVLEIQDGDQIGFCFSRALLIHYWLLKEGVPQSEIAKIFTIGDLMVGNIFWKFHVAVLLRDPVEGFVVVDPLQKDVLSAKAWLKTNSKYDIKSPLSRARFYITSPRKFLPSFGAYDLKQLQDPHYKKYFDDLVPSLSIETHKAP